jgi:hypothetical protein
MSLSTQSAVFEVNTMLEFHNATYPNTTTPHPFVENTQYGKLDVFVERVPQPPLIIENVLTWDIVFTIDNSGSMSDKCKDNRTKMEHIIHTLSNIVRLFSQKDPSAYCFNIYIQIFDTVVTKVLNFTKVSPENLTSIIELIENIYPEGQTNLITPLNICKSLYKERRAQFPQNTFLHIILTDGEDNCNSESVFDNTSIELQYASEFKSIFIGLGITHDCEKLSSFVCKNNDNEYYFIDKLENAGIVYGEIIHNILNIQFIEVNISIENGLVYNWKTNEWVSNMDIGALYANKHRSFHVKSETPQLVKGCICGQYIYDSKPSRKSIQLDDFTTLPDLIDITTGKKDTLDLTQYIYRYIVQNVLYKCVRLSLIDDCGLSFQNFHENPNNTFKKELAELFTEMKEYVKKNKETSNTFWNVLLDDIFILYKTINTPYFYMFTLSRYMSQGLQRAYAVTNIQDLLKDIQNNIGRDANYIHDIIRNKINNINQTLYTYDTMYALRTPTLQREFTQSYNDYDYDYVEDADDVIDPESVYEVQGIVGYVAENSDIYAETIHEYLNDEIQHELSDNIDSPYMTQDIHSVMRSVSC